MTISTDKPLTCWMIKRPNGTIATHYGAQDDPVLAAREWRVLLDQGYPIVKVEIRDVQ